MERDTAHRIVADWLNEHGTTAQYQGTGGNNEIVIVDVPQHNIVMGFTSGDGGEWDGTAYPRREDGDIYLSFWENDGLDLFLNGPDEDASPEVVGSWILDQIAVYKAPPLCGCPDHTANAVESDECICLPECIRFEARTLDFNSRRDLIEWLSWNDANGCYSDADATAEFGAPHSLEMLQEIYRGLFEQEQE